MSFLGGLFGGGSSNTTTTTTAASTTNDVKVNVSVPITQDTQPLQAAIDALAGATASGQFAVASALQANANAVKGSSDQAAQAGITAHEVEIAVALIGLVAALIYAHVIRFSGVRL